MDEAIKRIVVRLLPGAVADELAALLSSNDLRATIETMPVG